MRRYIVIIVILSITFSCSPRESSAKIKASNLAGTWYPAGARDLAKQIDTLLRESTHRKSSKEGLLFILPHAGYGYSGKIAAAGYRLIGEPGTSRIAPGLIVIMAPSHYRSFHGCSLIDAEFFETPLGRVKIDAAAARLLGSGSLFARNPGAFEREHAIEIHLPFLQRIFGSKLESSIPVLPILIGDIDDGEARTVARKIAAVAAGRSPLFIVSSDFTHYGPRFGYRPFRHAGPQVTAARLAELDGAAIDLIVKKDLPGFSGYVDRTGITICGRNAIRVALALPISAFSAEKLAYDTSGRITGDYDNSVSYAAVAFYGRLEGSASAGEASESLTSDDRSFLLKIARDNIMSWISKGRGIRMSPDRAPKNTIEKRGVFVTLKKRGELRGCIGYLTGIKPLVLAVLDNSYNAAFKDPRFPPVTAGEMKKTAIEISVLTEPVPVSSVDEIRTGRDGLIVERGTYRGLLLPQVAVEQGWDRDTFLGQTCLKAGLPAGAWKERETKIYRFQAIVFGESGI
ncbi:MAG: AmmeMemoRadiSam system protein B [Spirochaetes bacterium]|nr:AmmeMemoRadiSam system protein B [Spirochaetota bacterium]